MKYSKWIVPMAFAGLVLSAGPGFAKESPEMSKFFQEKMTQMEESLDSAEAEQVNSCQPTMILTDINVQIMPTVSFGIASVLSLTIAPEVDFMLTQKTD